MAEPCASESSADSDQDFDPSAEMLVDEFDDEKTLEEEEALGSDISVANELENLQKEGEMPLEELLEKYNYKNVPSPANAGGDAGEETSEEESSEHEEESSEKEEESENQTPAGEDPPEPEAPVAREPPPRDRTPSSSHLLRSKDKAETEPEQTFHYHYPHLKLTTRGRRNVAVSRAGESSNSESDEDYSLEDYWRKNADAFADLGLVNTVYSRVQHQTIQVGSDYQAQIPDGLCKYDDAPAYENEDRLLWDPSKLSDNEVEDYLHEAQKPVSNNLQSVNDIPCGSHIRDDEQALFLLLQCGHNVEEALRRRRMHPVPATEMSLWSEEECRSFETGLRTYGKDFHLIQQNKVRTRSVGELVQFYYLWKKTERHDVFASKNRLEKKKYALHPGTTDYMDKFLDEQENTAIQRDRSSSPSQSLLYGDPKRQRLANISPVTKAEQDGARQDNSSSNSCETGKTTIKTSPSPVASGTTEQNTKTERLTNECENGIVGKHVQESKVNEQGETRWTDVSDEDDLPLVPPSKPVQKLNNNSSPSSQHQMLAPSVTAGASE